MVLEGDTSFMVDRVKTVALGNASFLCINIKSCLQLSFKKYCLATERLWIFVMYICY